MIGVTIGIGETYQKMAELAAESVREHTGLSTRIVTQSWNGVVGVWLKLYLFKIFPDVDCIFYFDADTRMRANWDVRRLESGGLLCVVHDYPALFEKCADCQRLSIDPTLYFNAGMLILHREHQGVLDLAWRIGVEDYVSADLKEQTYLNAAVQRTKTEVLYLHRRYNHMYYGTARSVVEGADCIDVLGGKPPNIVLAHAAGGTAEDKMRFLSDG